MLALMASLSCTHQESSHSNNETTVAVDTISSIRSNAVYFWKTIFDPDSAEIAFLKEHDIKKIYIRYFDIVFDPANAPEYLVPNATLQFKKPVPEELEVVPTIFITNEAMANWPRNGCSRRDAKDESYYLNQLIYRIKAMNTRNGISKVREIQVDCDWSRSTRLTFFYFCQKLNGMLKKDSIVLSSTIRLHQLKEDLPPVKRGVLMCYNTGALRNISTDNSILSEADVYSYIRNVDFSKIRMPIDIAYPTFAWCAMYSPERKFIGIVRKTDLSDVRFFRKVKDNLYEVIKETASGNVIIKKGNLLRLEQSDYKVIKSIKEQLMLKYTESGYVPSNILYHLDSQNLSKYSYDEIETLYN